MKIYLRSISLRSNERKSFSSYRSMRQTGPQVWEDRKRTQAQWIFTKKTAAQGISQMLPRKSCWSELDRVLLKRFELSLRCWSACLRFRPTVSLALLSRLSSSDPNAKSSDTYSSTTFQPSTLLSAILICFCRFRINSFPSFINSLTVTLWPSVSALILSRTESSLALCSNCFWFLLNRSWATCLSVSDFSSICLPFSSSLPSN